MVDLANFKFPLKNRNLDDRNDHVAILYINGIVEEKVDTMEVDDKKGEKKKIRQEGQNIIINFVRKQNHRMYPDVICVRVFEVTKGNKNGMMPATPFAECNMIINETVKTSKTDVVVDFWEAGERIFSHEKRRFLDPDESDEEEETEEEEEEESGEEEVENSEESSSEEKPAPSRAKKAATQPKTPTRRQ